MATGEYVPVFTDTDTVTLSLSAACVAANVLVVTGDGTVGPSSAASAAVVGVAEYSAASGSRVAVNSGRIQELVASGSITAGATVEAAAAGAVASHTNGTNDVYIVGVALTTATNGALVRVLWTK